MLNGIPVSCIGCATGRIGFCANLGSPAIDQIARVAKAVRFKKSQVIAHKEDMPATALILCAGMIKVSHTLTDGRQQIVDFLTTGDILISNNPDNAVSPAVEGITKVDGREISLEDLEALCASSPEFGQSLLGSILCEIGRKNHQVMMLGRKRSDERVASFLLDFSDRAERRGNSASHLNLPMSRAEIADYLSLTTETVSRVFSVLREEKVIRMPKPHEVVIRDNAGLLEIAGGGANLSVR